jgi:hypothetical protein
MSNNEFDFLNFFKENFTKETKLIEVLNLGKISQDLISIKRNFAIDKERTHLPKRCKNKNCSTHQHFEDVNEAKKNVHCFQAQKGKSTYCTCGSPVQYFNGTKWVSSASLTPTKHFHPISGRKNIQSETKIKIN